jgi:hypothetical protein
MIFDANCKIVDGLQKIAFNPIMCCAAHKREREREIEHTFIALS